jgi:riboflavin kinase/FMN adenylyltransferase
MKVIFGLNHIKKYKKPVVALGIFDGVHRAHRRILKEVVKISRQIKGTSMVLTFWPHPQKKDSLYSLEHRLRLISEIGVEVCVVIGFNRAFSQISPADFIKDILVERIGIHYLCVGKNFRFGKDAKGEFKTLKKLSRLYNFKIKVFEVIKINRRSVSSTDIRRLITKGNLSRAQKLLYRPISILGTVIRGTSLGKELGFPTANINPHHEIIPPSGVYAVKIILNHKKLRGLCYIGRKPTFRHQKEKSIEVYIFNFKRNIYGEYLQIEFIKKIRNEKKFQTPAALLQQIRKDITSSRKIFSLP